MATLSPFPKPVPDTGGENFIEIDFAASSSEKRIWGLCLKTCHGLFL
jgi:hypothetical protein